MLLPALSENPDLPTEQDRGTKHQQECHGPIPAEQDQRPWDPQEGQQKKHQQVDHHIDAERHPQAMLTARKAWGEETGERLEQRVHADKGESEQMDQRKGKRRRPQDEMFKKRDDQQKEQSIGQPVEDQPAKDDGSSSRKLVGRFSCPAFGKRQGVGTDHRLQGFAITNCLLNVLLEFESRISFLLCGGMPRSSQ